MKRKTVSIIKNEILTTGLLGVNWILIGIGNIYKGPKLVDLFTTILMAITVIITLVVLIKAKPEDDDERSTRNRGKASTIILLCIQIILVIIPIILTAKEEFVVDILKVIPFCIGAINISYVSLFMKYEKVGY